MPPKKIVHTHWNYGMGPNKELKFNCAMRVETQCSKCAHNKVCDHKMEDRCVNYKFGRSDEKSCLSCVHRFTRFDTYRRKEEPEKDNSIPCFKCDDFMPIKKGV